MKKSKKILIIVILSLAVALVLAGIICYNLWPDLTKQYINTAWEWINEPLPIVGVSVSMILIFAWRLFAASSLGKKQINEFKGNAEEVKKEFELLQESYKNKISVYESQIDKFKSQYEYYKNAYKELCETIPNKKVKLLGEKYYAEKEIDNKTEAE